MSDTGEIKAKPVGLIILAFACIYVIWGSTFLVIRVALDSLPPFLIGAIRNLAAGSLMLLWVQFRLRPRQQNRIRMTGKQIALAALTGFLLGTCGNGLLIFAEIKIPTGTASLWVATVPIWFLLLNWAFFERKIPPILAGIGSFLGCVGIALLPSATKIVNPQAGDWLYWTALLGSAVTWSFGSLIQRRFIKGVPTLTLSGLQMLAGGVFMAIGSCLTGEFSELLNGSHPFAIEGILAVAYLAVFGSIVAFTAYSWLIGVVDPQKVATYALVNPVLAVALGAIVKGERLSFEVIIAAGLVLISVALIMFSQPRTSSGASLSTPPNNKALQEKDCA